MLPGSAILLAIAYWWHRGNAKIAHRVRGKNPVDVGFHPHKKQGNRMAPLSGEVF
jgi:hypothetical protein